MKKQPCVVTACLLVFGLSLASPAYCFAQVNQPDNQVTSSQTPPGEDPGKIDILKAACAELLNDFGAKVGRQIRSMVPTKEMLWLSGKARFELSKAEFEPIEKFFPTLLEEQHRSAEALAASAPVAKSEDPVLILNQQKQAIIKIFNRPEDYQDKTQFTEAEFAEFRAQFLKVLNLHRKSNDGITGSKAFKAWARSEVNFYMAKAEMARLIGEGQNFRSFFESELRPRYLAMTDRDASKLQKMLISKATNPVVAIPVSAVLGTTVWMYHLIRQAMIAGTLPLYINAYSGSLQNPLIQKVTQVGNRQLATPALKIQYLLIENHNSAQDAEKLKELVKSINAKGLKSKSPEEAEAILKRRSENIHPGAVPVEEYLKAESKRYETLIKTSLELNTRESGFLPGNQNSARGLFWNSQIYAPMDLARMVAEFNSNEGIHKLLLEGAQNRMASLQASSHPNATEIQKLRSEIDAETMAVQGAHLMAIKALATWKFYEFIFPELTSAGATENERTNLNIAYETVKNSPEFHLFLEQYDEQAVEIVTHIQDLIRHREEFLKDAQNLAKTQPAPGTSK